MSSVHFFTLLLVGFIDYLGIGLVYPVFAALLFDSNYPLLGLDATQGTRGAILGILICLTPFMQFFSAPLLGSLSDRKGRKKTLLFGLSFGLLGYILAVVGITTQSLWLLFVYRILVGVSEGTVGVAQAMIADLSANENEEQKTKRFGRFNASLGLGFTVGPFLGGLLADPDLASWSGYGAPFLLAASICTLNLVLICWKLPESRSAAPVQSQGLLDGLKAVSKIIGWKAMRPLFVATFAFSFGWSFFNEFVPVLLRMRFDFSPSQVGNYYALGGVAYALSASFGISPLLARFSNRKIVTGALLGCAITMLLFLTVQESASIMWLVLPLMYAIAASHPTMTAMVSSMAPQEEQGQALGLYQAVFGIAMGLSPLIVGSAVGIYPELTAWGGACSMFLASLALWLGSRRHMQAA